MTKSVESVLDDIRMLGELQFQIVEAVRTLARSTFASLDEEVKYGGILFSSGVQFSGAFAYRAHVSVEFSQGAKIVDPNRFLEGSGKGRRHIKLRSTAEVSTKNLAGYLLLAHGAATSAA